MHFLNKKDILRLLAMHRPISLLCHRCKSLISTSKLKVAKYSYGQPTPATHPHLLSHGQVVPGILQQEFEARRYRLMEKVRSHALQHGLPAQSRHVVVIPSATKLFMSDKIPYPFRQNTEFLYFTGFHEPDSVLVLSSFENRNLPEHQSTLFIQKKNVHTELWEGPRTEPESAVEFLGVDAAMTFDELEQFLKSNFTAKTSSVLWYDFINPPLPIFHKMLEELVKDAPNSLRFEFESLRKLMHHVRLIKSDSEIRLMRKSAEIGAESLKEVIKASCKPQGLREESHLWARMEYECRYRGAERLAYPPVVAGGPRANTIHYIHNNQTLIDGEMVLMDAGCEYHGYVSDITRTWPIGGWFREPAMRELYEAVLEVQEELIELCVPSKSMSLNQLFQAMTQLLGVKLQELKVMAPNVGKVELSQTVAHRYCPHHVGHYLGMDVHDCPDMSRNLAFKPGMVITVEPGLYLRETDPGIPPSLRGIGVRIEDDILITNTGPQVLSSRCPKRVEDIQRLISEDATTSHNY